jgi:hypothetical protein
MRRRESVSDKRHVSLKLGLPETELKPVKVLDDILVDNIWDYQWKITHLHSWQFFHLTDHLKDLIKRPGAHYASVKVGVHWLNFISLSQALVPA